MSRLTGSETRGLMEAYASIHAPQEQIELTEEQVWEEVENWVNSLLEEGYDLSEYTWEEMYENYIEEKGMDVFSTPAIKKGQVNQALSVFNPQKSKPTPDAITSFTNSPASQKAQVRAAQDLFGITQKSVPPATDKGTGGADRDGGAPTRDVIVKAAKGGVPGSLNKTTGKWTSSGGSSRPSAAAPSKVAPTKPTAPAKPATGMLGKTSFERRTPTSAELKAAQAARASGASPEKALQAAKTASAPAAKTTPAATPSLAQKASGLSLGSSQFKPATTSQATAAAPSTSSAASGSVVSASDKIAATKKLPAVAPSGSASGGAPLRKEPLWNSYQYDTFDIVAEYLIDNGHAETIEEAIYIMANMSEEWRESILDEGDNYDRNRKRAAQRAAERNAARDRGQTGNVPGVGYVTSRRERETYTDAAGTERHKTGARMPEKKG